MPTSKRFRAIVRCQAPAPRSLALTALVLVLASLAPAQDTSLLRPSPARRATYIDQEQVAALSTYVTTVLGSAAQPDDLLQLSRLLSEPRDQILWLIEQVRWLGRQAGGSRQAQALAERTEQRIALWTSRGVRGLEPLAELLERTKTEIQPALWTRSIHRRCRQPTVSSCSRGVCRPHV